MTKPKTKPKAKAPRRFTPANSSVILAAEKMDWIQVILNNGPPCFYLDPEDDGHFCGRAHRWEGHDDPDPIHRFVSLAALLRSLSPNTKVTDRLGGGSVQ